MKKLFTAFAALLFLAACSSSNPLSDRRNQVVMLDETCSGFFVAPDLVATAGHCVTAIGEKFKVTLFDGTVLEGIAIIDNDVEDVAIIKVDKPTKLGYTTLLCDYKPRIGDDVTVIGHPQFIYRWFVSFGKIGGYGPVNDARFPQTFIWFTAPVAGGNSGGPVFDMFGRVVGMVSVGMASVLNGAVHVKHICKELHG